MSCSGLHCAGCGGGSAAPVVAFAIFCGVDWIAAHIVEVAAVSAACGVLAVAAVVALMRWADRRDALRTALWAVRAEAAGTPRVATAVTSAERPALAPAVMNLNFYGVPADERAAIIRTAFPGTAGDAITEGK